MKYARTIVLEAMKYDGTNHLEIARHFPNLSFKYRDGQFTVFRHTDDYVARAGDYVSEDHEGKHFVHDGARFEATYERVPGDEAKQAPDQPGG